MRGFVAIVALFLAAPAFADETPAPTIAAAEAPTTAPTPNERQYLDARIKELSQVFQKAMQQAAFIEGALTELQKRRQELGE